jgi:hypothetical protein
MTAPLRYRAYGLSIRSELPLPELAVHDVDHADDAPADLEIRFGPVSEPARPGTGYVVEDGETRLVVPEVGRFLIGGGAEIVIDPAPGASERNLRLFVLGSAMGAVIHQRGLLPLHANAVLLGESVVAFSGPSGAGKSTLAAWFHDRGHPLLADDVCAVALGADGPVVHAGAARIRLWRDALEAGGRSTDGRNRSFDRLDKWDVPTRHLALERPLPLAAVYTLARAPEGAGDEVTIRRIAGAAAVHALSANTYRGAYTSMAGLTETHFRLCTQVARHVPVYEVSRTWSLDRLDAVASELRRHAGGEVG